MNQKEHTTCRRTMMNARNSKSAIVPKSLLAWVVVHATWLTCHPLFAATFANYGRIVFPDGVINGADTRVWNERASMPWARTGCAACSVNGKIYVFGGYTFSPYVSSFKTVAEYDPVADVWTTKAEMPTPRTWLSCSALNGKIYVIGGMQGPVEQGNAGLHTVEEYDPATDSWTRKADMLTGRAVAGTCVADGKIYAISGVTTFAQTLSSVEAYDPTTDTWTARKDLPQPRGVVSAVQVNGQIYATGRGTPADGFSSRMDRYDPTTDSWTQVSNMPTARGFMTLAPFNGQIYAVGGISGGPLSTVEVYDAFTDRWMNRGDMVLQNSQGNTVPFRSYGLASAVVNDTIYVMGGAQGNLSGDSNIVLAYSSPTSNIFAELLPSPSAFGLPSSSDPPMPGWDENAVVTVTNAGTGGAVTLNPTTLVVTIPIDETFTHIAYDDVGNELGRLVLRAVGQHTLDLNDDHSVVDEMAGTIRVEFGGGLLNNQPSASLSVVEAAGIYISDALISQDRLSWYASGYVLLPLNSDPSIYPCLQGSILDAFGTGQIMDMNVYSLWMGEYQEVATRTR